MNQVIWYRGKPNFGFPSDVFQVPLELSDLGEIANVYLEWTPQLGQ